VPENRAWPLYFFILPPPSLNEAVRLLGKLGGHLGRAHDGEPGSEVLWRGMARLADIERAYDLYH
jgi:hypothetical protein